MANIPVTRRQFLLPFVGILDEIGAPTNGDVMLPGDRNDGR